ncbi:MFS transporter [Mangrovactinospora gilvigrisea]|uniref:MFS transporter n=1 Tax=Mangrovactinospora gilvigrisea TaxID=1428644 RepID=A0A1J7B9K2_9ACTN|nr:MFS transporter [Mangrovactinospora gilvigrisea]OIV35331.1 MFS transporter [Mangrovactinospora gilvigrisea]
MSDVASTRRTRGRAADPGSRSPGRGLLPLMAVAAGLSVAGNYFAQPLLDVIARQVHLAPSLGGLVVTVAQVGYGAGLLLLVPLGDLLDRRRLAVLLTALTAAFLLVTATATNAAVLLAGTALTGLTSVAAQVIVPFAASLAEPERRGRAVGTVMTGLLLGILLARTASGLLAGAGGWRTVFFVNAGLMAVMAVALHRRLPSAPPETAGGERPGYPRLLGSSLALLAREPALRWRGAMGALAFGVFSVLWTALAFLMSGPPYHWSTSAIGLLGLVGAAGSLSASVTGRLGDRGLVHRVSGISAALLLVSWAVLAAGGSGGAWGLVALLAGMLVLDAASQGVHISNQNIVYALRPEIRNRLNSVYMTLYFIGGAAGSAGASALWGLAGWTGVCALGGAMSAALVAVWTLDRILAHR